MLDGKNPAKSVDVAVESEVVALFEELRGRFGRIDVLVNGAAVADTLLSGIEEYRNRSNTSWMSILPAPSPARARRCVLAE